MHDSQQESSTLEFRRFLPENDQILKTVLGFCNQSGGRLMIGIDSSGTVIDITEEASIAEIITLTRLSRASCGRKLKEMVDQGLLIRVGKGRAIRYKKATEDSP